VGCYAGVISPPFRGVERAVDVNLLEPTSAVNSLPFRKKSSVYSRGSELDPKVRERRAVLPRRWVVERTFSWFGRNRRLAKDFENLAETLATFVTLASIQLALRRLARVSALTPVG